MRRTLIALATLLLAVVVFVVVFTLARPRRAMESSPRIVDAQAEQAPTFVGKQVCAECHQSNFHLHAASGHATTLRPASEPIVAEHFIDEAYDAGESFGTYRYLLEPDGLSVTSGEYSERAFPLEYAFGSGHNAITLVTLVADEDGKTVGMEHRATWFSSNDCLGPTPGQHDAPPEFSAEVFGFKKTSQEISECIGCHTTTFEFHEDRLSLGNLRPNVNCERCHGPGSEHVRQARDNPVRPAAFSVGRDDWTINDEISLCGECHRMPQDFSPLALREYANVMPRFQPVGLLRSECFLKSKDLRCTTCHNPHETSTARTTQQYESVCLDCHRQAESDHIACPQSPTERCIECHMPRVKFVGDIGFHDHWIRVRDSNKEVEILPESPASDRISDE
ncbi:multiheme c-type cytochrome [Neorhodopirellula pilleata]|uniref:multiheme c-type cytochrome n=1 Tax=Neorhodopirellula pilleata TaxID=2714738 RepID=UPI0011B4830E|nr:multiheme c-type cytochrome [Neorhodopirellula pilleata]